MNTSTVNIFDDLKDFVTSIKKSSGLSGKDKVRIESVKTGFVFLDHFTDGLVDGDYVVLAGRPCTGKTTLSLNIALNVILSSEKDVLYFSLSSTKEMIMAKLFTMISQIPSPKGLGGNFNVKDLARIDQRISHLTEANLFVQDEMYSMAEIEDEVLKFKNQSNLGLVIIDYLQLIDKPIDFLSSDRPAELSAISRSIRKLSKAIRLPIILISSVDSAVDLREFNKRPLLTDINAPSSVIDDCDMVWMLYRDELLNKCEDNPNIGAVDLAILKNRRGCLNLIEMRFIEEMHRFEDIGTIFAK